MSGEKPSTISIAMEWTYPNSYFSCHRIERRSVSFENGKVRISLSASEVQFPAEALSWVVASLVQLQAELEKQEQAGCATE